MFHEKKPLFLICETPLHAGSGNDLGYVDMPIQRERHTTFPKIEGSSLKGALRQAFEENVILNSSINKYEFPTESLSKEQLLEDFDDVEADWKIITKNEVEIQAIKYQEFVEKAFGPDNPKDESFAGALGFTDARLLLFPVKSAKGVFAWVTCPKVLEQFSRDMEKLKISDPPQALSEGEFLHFGESDVVIDENNIILEEYSFTKNDNACDVKVDGKSLPNWLSETLFPKPESEEQDIYGYWRSKIEKDIIILSDTDFGDFVNLSTEVITRTAIDNDTGTVKGTALFTEEYLPSESVMYSLILGSPEFSSKEDKWDAKKVMTFFEKGLKPVIQLGGNATLGKGLLRTKLISI
jgi:CRISPR-associated protein Cmr4